MTRLLTALICAAGVIACASAPPPLPSHLDPSNPDAPEATPVAVSPTLEPPTAPAAPARSEQREQPAGTAELYACPMHPEVTSNAPGKCPKCGMALVQQKPAPSAIVYTCPMHPEVRSDKPGTCPKCRMRLVPEQKPPPDASTPSGHHHPGGGQ